MKLLTKIKQSINEFLKDNDENEIDYRALFSDILILDGKQKYIQDIAMAMANLCVKTLEFEQGRASVNQISGYVADVEIQIEKLKTICPELAKVVTLQKANTFLTMFDDVLKRSEEYDDGTNTDATEDN